MLADQYTGTNIISPGCMSLTFTSLVSQISPMMDLMLLPESGLHSSAMSHRLSPSWITTCLYVLTAAASALPAPMMLYPANTIIIMHISTNKKNLTGFTILICFVFFISPPATFCILTVPNRFETSVLIWYIWIINVCSDDVKRNMNKSSKNILSFSQHKTPAAKAGVFNALSVFHIFTIYAIFPLFRL